MMQKTLIHGFALLTCITISSMLHAQNQRPERPNIILFLVDDMGWTDTSVPFGDEPAPNNRVYDTPNMQRLASKGVRFSDAYAQSVCTPTRVSLVTGMNSARHRVTNWTNSGTNQPTDAPYPRFNWPDWNYNGLATEPGQTNTAVATPLPSLLRKAGYYTAIVGKGHFAPYGVPASNPENIGFIESVASDATGRPRSYLGTDNFGNSVPKTFDRGVRGLEAYHGQDIFLSEALTLEAQKAMDKALDLNTPFFLYFSHYAVHTPIMADNRFYQKYLDRGLDSTEAKYASLVEGMDKSLGDVMDYLDVRHISDNTIILFMSDNGGLSLNPPRGGAPFKHNYPLKSGKGAVYEGGIRVPMIAYWPGVTQPGSIARQYIQAEDFFPTILEIARVTDYTTQQRIDGVSFVPSLKASTAYDSSRTLLWHFPSNWGQGLGTLQKYFPVMRIEDVGFGPTTAVRRGDWKLIYFYGTGHVELYNLRHDIGEAQNLANAHPDRVQELLAEMSRKLQEKDAQFPISAQTGKVVRPKLP
ncbi:sulfatase [Parapedobacter deserti]|uniref:Sulfatase n=1 Tax=Parapedobacter deserti TaxID=1912957 RepID=A0ABV7JRR2_9SPHI